MHIGAAVLALAAPAAAAEATDVSNERSNDFSMIDVAKRGVVKSITVGQAPWGVAIAP